jgi:acyl carrier protein
MAESIQSRVIAILAEQAGRPAAGLGPETALETLGMDSVALVEALFAIEEAFDITVPYNANTPDAPEAAFDLTTLGSIARGVEALVAEKAA